MRTYSELAIVGCGNMGTAIAKAVDNGRIDAELTAVYDIELERAESLVNNLDSQQPKIASALGGLLCWMPTDSKGLVVETASPEFVKENYRMILAGSDLMMLSASAIFDIEEDLKSLLYDCDGRVYIPSGAAAAIDAAKATDVEEVYLTTTKPPKSLKPSEYFWQHYDGPGLDDLEEDTVVFPYSQTSEEGEKEYGDAHVAAKCFPRNVNISGTLYGAAGVEPLVKIIAAKQSFAAPLEESTVASPQGCFNGHEIKFKSPSTDITTTIKNKPSENPSSSQLASESAIGLLEELTDSRNVYVGT